jgi:hypothetical protein
MVSGGHLFANLALVRIGIKGDHFSTRLRQPDCEISLSGTDVYDPRNGS